MSFLVRAENVGGIYEKIENMLAHSVNSEKEV